MHTVPRAAQRAREERGIGAADRKDRKQKDESEREEEWGKNRCMFHTMIKQTDAT